MLSTARTEADLHQTIPKNVSYGNGSPQPATSFLRRSKPEFLRHFLPAAVAEQRSRPHDHQKTAGASWYLLVVKLV